MNRYLLAIVVLSREEEPDVHTCANSDESRGQRSVHEGKRG